MVAEGNSTTMYTVGDRPVLLGPIVILSLYCTQLSVTFRIELDCCVYALAFQINQSIHLISDVSRVLSN